MMPLSFSIDCAGLIARGVEDCALLLSAVAGLDADDPTSVDQPVPSAGAELPAWLAGPRIGVDEEYFNASIDAAVADRLDDALSVLRSLGARIVPLKIPSIEHAGPLLGIIVAAEAASLHERWIKSCPELYGAQTLARLLPGLMYRATDYLGALTRRGKLLADFADSVFPACDVLFAPTMLMQPPTLRESDVGDRPGFIDYLAPFGRCTRPASLFGLPAISVPAGLTRAGLPCGFQLIGRPFDEARLFAVAGAYEREVGPYPMPRLDGPPARPSHETPRASSRPMTADA
jgi:aspartyl-tRNA(Asn)/glutamyl-tRNA(Gln) amidotransferase subunit A